MHKQSEVIPIDQTRPVKSTTVLLPSTVNLCYKYFLSESTCISTTYHVLYFRNMYRSLIENFKANTGFSAQCQSPSKPELQTREISAAGK